MIENTGPDLVVAGLALGYIDLFLLASPARGPLLFDREFDRLQAAKTQLVTGLETASEIQYCFIAWPIFAWPSGPEISVSFTISTVGTFFSRSSSSPSTAGLGNFSQYLALSPVVGFWIAVSYWA